MIVSLSLISSPSMAKTKTTSFNFLRANRYQIRIRKTQNQKLKAKMKLMHWKLGCNTESHVTDTRQHHNTWISLKSLNFSKKLRKLTLINIKIGSRIKLLKDWKAKRKKLKRRRIFCNQTLTKLTAESWLNISLVSAATTTKLTLTSIYVGYCAGAHPWGTRTRRKRSLLLSKQLLLSWRCTTRTIRLHCRRSLKWWWTALTTTATSKWCELYSCFTVNSSTWNIHPECFTWC